MKWLLKFARLGLVVITVSLLTILTTGYVVNTYIQSLLSSYNLPIASQTPSLGGIVKGMLGFGSDRNQDPKGDLTQESTGQTGLESEEPEESQQSSTGDRSGAGDSGANLEGLSNEDEEAISGPESSGGDGDTEEEVPEGSVPVMGGIAGDSAGAQDQQVLVTPDDLVAKKDELSDSEKEEVFATLMSKLPQEEMQRMSELIEGGLTETEMIEIEQILSKHLSKEEYAKMLNILKK